MKNMKKTLALVLAFVMVAAGSIAATVAWLQDNTDTIENTFTVGKVYIDLTEAKTEFHVIPSQSETKQPIVTVEAGSEEAYVYVKVEEDLGVLADYAEANSKEFSDYIVYSVDSAWTALDGVPGVYYRTVAKDDAAQSFDVLTGNTVSYPSALTNADLAAAQNLAQAADNANNLPSLSFTAYAIQTAGTGTAAEAWATAGF